MKRRAYPQESKKQMTARPPDFPRQQGKPREKKEKRPSRFFARAVDQFQSALRRVVPFSAADAMGDHKSLSWGKLSQSAGVSRGALGNYLSDAGLPLNPSLESICRLAEELSIPPAFLLMTADDWMRVFAAIHTYQVSMQGHAKFQEHIEQSVARPDYACKPVDIIRDALKIARMTDVGKDAVGTAASVIANVSLAMPLRDFRPEVRGLALVVASVVATSSEKSQFLREQESQMASIPPSPLSTRPHIGGSNV